MTLKKDLGICITAIFSILFGLYLLFEKGDIILNIISLIKAKQGLLIGGLILNILQIAAGVGIFKKIERARLMFMFLTFFFLAEAVYTSFFLVANNLHSRWEPILNNPLYLIVCLIEIALLIYLTRPKVKEQFK